MSQQELLKKLLEAGVHFGHQTRRWNPKMKRFIFGERSGIYIIDLEKTIESLQQAQEYVKDVASRGGKFLFVGTKKQAQISVEEVAKKTEMYFVANRWPGGLLTNFETVKKSLARLTHIEQLEKDGTMENLKKKEVSQLKKEQEKLMRDLGGIREMRGSPNVLVVVDTKKEENAVREAIKLKIPVVAVLDTNCDPDMVDFPIPGNDDALKSIRLITSLIGDSINEGRKLFNETVSVQQKAAQEVPSAEETKPAEAQS